MKTPNPTGNSQNLKISLSVLNGRGCAASIENDDESSLTVHEDFYNPCPKEACRAAAANLRHAADLFEKLATMKKPFHEATHNKVNR